MADMIKPSSSSSSSLPPTTIDFATIYATANVHSHRSSTQWRSKERASTQKVRPLHRRQLFPIMLRLCREPYFHSSTRSHLFSLIHFTTRKCSTTKHVLNWVSCAHTHSRRCAKWVNRVQCAHCLCFSIHIFDCWIHPTSLSYTSHSYSGSDAFGNVLTVCWMKMRSHNMPKHSERTRTE